VSGHDFSRADNLIKFGVGIKGCGKTLRTESFVSGHDFSRADELTKISVGFSPCHAFSPASKTKSALFRSLFSPCP
jgi:hypothetical protein